LKIWSAKRGVEGLLHCYDEFQKMANKFEFDVDDYQEHFPEILDESARRSWEAHLNLAPAVDRDVPWFHQTFKEFVTKVSNTDNP
jgi:hypothetical protein